MQTVKPEEIVAILKEHGTQVSEEQANSILQFMYKLANIALDQYFGSDNGCTPKSLSKQLPIKDPPKENTSFI